MIASRPFRDGTASGVLVYGSTTRLELGNEPVATGPVSANAVRVVSSLGMLIAVGPNAEATVQDMFVPAERVELIATEPGDVVSVLQNPAEIGGGVAWVSEVAA